MDKSSSFIYFVLSLWYCTRTGNRFFISLVALFPKHVLGRQHIGSGSKGITFACFVL